MPTGPPLGAPVAVFEYVVAIASRSALSFFASARVSPFGSGRTSTIRDRFSFGNARNVAGSTMSIGGGGSPCGFGRSNVRSPHQYDGSGLTGMPRYRSRIVSEYGVDGVEDRLARAVEALRVRDRPVDLDAGPEPRDRLRPVRRGCRPCTERRQTQSVVLPGAIEEHRPDRGRRSRPGHDLRDGLGDERGLGVRDVRGGLDQVGLGAARVAGQPHDEPGVSEARAVETDLHGFARGRRHVERSSREAGAREGRGGRDADVCPQARPHAVQTLGAAPAAPRATAQ